MVLVPVRGGEFLPLGVVFRRAGGTWSWGKRRSPHSDTLGGGPSNPAFGGCPRSDLLPGLNCEFGSKASLDGSGELFVEEAGRDGVGGRDGEGGAGGVETSGADGSGGERGVEEEETSGAV